MSDTPIKEQALAFGPSGSQIGVLSEPAEGRRSDRPGFLILNSGMVHRVGPNRISVGLARDLARLGFSVLRFDFSGIGDTPASGTQESILGRFIAETRGAMDFLAAARNVQRFALLGNCSGAAVSFATAAEDPRVCGAAMINPQGPGGPGYFLRLLRNPKSWRRLLRGVARLETLTGLFRSRERAPGPDAPRPDPRDSLRRLLAADTRVLFVFCEWDPGLDHVKRLCPGEVRQLIAAGQFHVIPGMDHEFDLMAGQRDLRSIVSDWAAHWSIPAASRRQ